VLLEIQDTLRQPPKAQGTMRKAISIGVSGAFIFYFSSAVACYSALGNNVPGEVLSGFESEFDLLQCLRLSVSSAAAARPLCWHRRQTTGMPPASRSAASAPLL
jgi:amino acid permease